MGRAFPELSIIPPTLIITTNNLYNIKKKQARNEVSKCNMGKKSL